MPRHQVLQAARDRAGRQAPLQRAQKEEEHREVTTSFRTYIENNGEVADEESTGETFSAAKKVSLEDSSNVPTLEGE